LRACQLQLAPLAPRPSHGYAIPLLGTVLGIIQQKL
jgi:hypothetical protein